VGVFEIRVKSWAEYMAAIATMNEVMKPIDQVLNNALGTASEALVASSAK